MKNAHRPSSGIPVGTVGPPWFPRVYNLSGSDVRTHVHVIGVSGSGKSRFLAGLYVNLINRGFPATLIDPHGDLAQLVLTTLVASGAYDTSEGFDRVLYLDLPAGERQGRFLPFNVLKSPYSAHTTARNTLEALRRAWPALDGGVAPNFENIVLAGCFVLVHHGLALPQLHDLLVDKPWRDRLLTTVPDEQVVRFFRERYDRWNRDQPTLIESSLRRIFLLAFSPVLRYSLLQSEMLLDYREILDKRRSVIVNLALGDSDARRLLGCLLTVAAEQAALSRADIPASERSGSHFLMLDEFSEFTAQSEESLARILSLCRKYGLYLVMAHQTWSQTSERLQGALQNAGAEVVFRLGRGDAAHSAQVLGRVDPSAIKHEVSDSEVVDRSHPVFYSLPEQWEAWIQAIQDLRPREAFLKQQMRPTTKIRTLAMPDPVVDEHKLRAVESTYLARYFRSREEIEATVAANFEPQPATSRFRRFPQE
jgi:Helicase HerA, central domain/Type IV secretion-system coupling protein DNA-binding domain